MNSTTNANVKQTIRDNVESTLDITPSVIVLARLAKVSPDVFAKGLSDKKANALYTVALVAETTKASFEESLKNDKKGAKDEE